MAEFVGAPGWVIALCGACIVVAVFLLPSARAAAITSTFIHSDQAKILAAISALIGFAVVIATAIEIREDYRYRAEERDVRREEAIARAWDRLLQRAPGNIGKGDALTFLVQQNVDMSGIDMSCEARGLWNSSSGSCSAAPIFAGVRTSWKPGDKLPAIMRANFRGVEFSDADLQLAFIQADFSTAQFSRVNVNRALLSGRFTATTFFHSDLTDTAFWIEQRLDDVHPAFHVPVFSNTNVSGAVLPWIEDTQELRGLGMIFWADWAPRRHIGPPDSEDARFAAEWFRNATICRPPTGLDGAAVPRSERMLVSRFSRENPMMAFPCDRLSIEEAVRMFPGEYALPPASVEDDPDADGGDPE